MKRSTKGRNRGKFEFRLVQPEVEKMLAEGYPVLQIYDELAAAGRLTMSYSNFCFYVRGQGERKPGLKKQQTLKHGQRPDYRPAVRPVIGEIDRSSFHHEKVANLDDLGPPAKK